MQTVISIPWLTGALLALMPAGLVLTALPSVHATRNAALATRQRVRWAAALALVAALAADLSYFLGSRGDFDIGHLPLPGLIFDLPISVTVDGLTLILASLVSFVVLTIAQYSVEYLDGDPHQARFFRLLAFTGGFFLLVVVSGNIGLFTIAIIATGFSLNKLLKFYGERPKAIMAAHKKSLFSRTADLFLLGATGLIGSQIGSLQFRALRQFVEHADRVPLPLQIAAWLIVGTVVLKSAHFPFQGWLIQVMEAPTPVSALMHAGVVYSGAIIALRTSALLVRVPDALWFLGLMGLATVLIASLVMTTQTAIKSMLAWSTTAQLGFMSLELGLGLFPLALLHLVGHSLYKAHAFLSSGSVTDQLRQVSPGGKKIPSTASWLLAVLAGMAISAGGAWMFGEDPFRDPKGMALVLIVGVAVAQILVKGLQFDNLADGLMALLLGVSAGLTYLVLHTLFVWGFTADLTQATVPVNAPYFWLLGLTMLGFLGLSWIQGPGRGVLSQRVQLVLFTHLYNGLYVDVWVERFSHRFWSERVGVSLPRKNLAVESLQSVARNRNVISQSGGSQ
ncbi:NADH-quinone oxidoreductase subunit L [Acidithiobacillus caldus]|jgi:NAD(P)H-quinone oxidoreductase subunit 5|uniref:Probable inorganic carbon transporter subunit DabB n=6 Tax=Acidithiobacillus caldus TaxID=33059 RepID=F9ZLI9_ACICS|nr:MULTISPECIES: proton-conducting transporter membrane subunit [Acidithiobacillus]AEK57739.1 NADH dehydrogenase, subunit 5 [Acidithiobacillus caldus SM-1]AIA54883.1 NADH dehydrogenase, subunit 5 [Acidithiobacillus caldus ATCC 51756]AUW32432.1 NADH-quinone oxidoreductase subunit L [Acidithiobacillus caldus]MBU2735099.1 NADH-quinone oxidoreductase subunit L [Acidithiobacillus caldus ATCC 51756]MCE5421101.1 NADH-quinone oxidoreductase subunit L [Acidithiobacillus sp.]